MYAYCGNNPTNFTDPTGHFFNFLAAGIGAAVGAVVGAAVTFVSDLIDDGEINTPVETYVGNTAGAAVTGLAAGLTCGASLALEGGGLALYTAGAYGLSSMAGSTARQAISTGEVDPMQVAVDGAVGAVTAGTLKYVGDKLSNADFGFKAYKGAGKTVTYSPAKPGPLKQGVAESFSGATYKEVALTQDTTFYRVYGGNSGKVGSYMTRVPQSGGMQSQIDLALNPEWGNTAKFVTKVTVPKGTIIYEGTAASQTINGGVGQLLGGGNQIYIPGVNASWFK